MKSYDGKHFQTVDRTRALQKSVKFCMKSYEGKHIQTVDRTRALQKYV